MIKLDKQINVYREDNGALDECVEPGISFVQLSGGRRTRCAGNDAVCVSGPSALRPCNASKPEALALAKETEKMNKKLNI